MKLIKSILPVILLGLIVFMPMSLQAEINSKKKEKGSQDEIQRQALGVYDLQKNTVSNIEFYTTNYGIFGFDVARTRGGGFWPRQSLNQYIFAGGIWFAARKIQPGTDQLRSYVSITYNPNSGRSWMVPGRIREGGPFSTAPIEKSVLNDADALKKYRTYFSTDFRPSNGAPINEVDGPAWPIWDAGDSEDTLKKNRYFGHYIESATDRNMSTYPKGPAFISGEDIFCTYKDTDLSRYEGGATTREQEGYPLMLQQEQMIYSWGFGDYRDFIFVKYSITNYSNDTLRDCWLAPVMDTDIARAPNTSFGAGNDRTRYYSEDPDLNLAFQWTDPNRGEDGFGFGYLGFDFLESPAVSKHYKEEIIEREDGTLDTIYVEDPDHPENNFIRKDKDVFSNDEQIGLKTFINWNIENDPGTDNDRYDFISSGNRDGDTGPGDKRFMMATGPFNMRPGDTVRTVVGIIIAGTTKGGNADGTAEDVAELVRLDKFAQEVYDNNFRAPQPPDRSVFTSWEGLNNSIIVKWDSTAEITVDPEEKGMDFMGYRLYRARRSDLEGYSEDNISSERLGPFGWKIIQDYAMPLPFRKSVKQPLPTNDRVDPADMPRIDSLRIVGPYYEYNSATNKWEIDSMAIRIMRVPVGVNVTEMKIKGNFIPVMTNIDSSMVTGQMVNGQLKVLKNPWGQFYREMYDNDPSGAYHEKYGDMQWYFYPLGDYITSGDAGTLPVPNRTVPISINAAQNLNIFDSVMVGKAQLNRALLKYNPMFWRKQTIEISQAEYDKIFNDFKDGIVGEYTFDTVEVVKPNPITGEPETTLVARKVITKIEEIYEPNSLRQVTLESGISYVADVSRPRDLRNIMTDSVHVQNMMDSLYTWILENKVTLEFPRFEDSDIVRNEVIRPYMTELTNDRTFYDLGDDDRDGVINFDEDPTKTEKLINNIDYFYKMLAYDEGDFAQPTERKLNDGSEGLPNVVQTYPTSSAVGKESKIKVIHVDSSLVGGLYNFNFFSVDQDRVNQNFAGDTLELEFQPAWQQSTIFLDSDPNLTHNVGLYQRNLVLRNLTTNDTLYNGTFYFEPSLCNLPFRDLLTEDGAARVFTKRFIIDEVTGDTITFGMPTSNEVMRHAGSFTTGRFNNASFCYSQFLAPQAKSTLGFEFDFEMKQYGGLIRAAEIEKLPGVTATTPVKVPDNPADPAVNLLVQNLGIDFSMGSFRIAGFNNGAGEYLLTFEPGGTETYAFTWGKKNENQGTFNVEYLNVKLENVTEYEAMNEKGMPMTVDYKKDMPHVNIPFAPMPEVLSDLYDVPFYDSEFPKYYPDPRNLAILPGRNVNEMIGGWNIAAFGFANGRNSNLRLNITDQIVSPATGPLSDPAQEETYTGVQGRYLKTATAVVDGKEVTIDFSHIITIGGQKFGLDYANKGYAQGRSPVYWDVKDFNSHEYGPDFKAGDQVRLVTKGGAMGLPLPGAKVRAVVTEHEPANLDYTESMLDDIKIVPNPYYVTHQGQKSPYDAKIYFTKLPDKCTIDIYTVSGDLIKSIDHNAAVSNSDNNYTSSVIVWDLLSDNRQRVSSQSLIAVITSDNGEQTVKNFSVIVGGFRLIESGN